jgi:hypothetical protein
VCGKENASYSSFFDDLRRKTTSIKVKDLLYESLLFDRV